MNKWLTNTTLYAFKHSNENDMLQGDQTLCCANWMFEALEDNQIAAFAQHQNKHQQFFFENLKIDLLKQN